MAEWIPVEKKQPKEDEMVLVTIRGSDVITQKEGETVEQAIERIWREVVYVSVGFLGEDGWYGADGFPMIVQPVAWMSLPAPYKGGYK